MVLTAAFGRREKRDLARDLTLDESRYRPVYSIAARICRTRTFQTAPNRNIPIRFEDEFYFNPRPGIRDLQFW
jgi:hypothetical protein